MLQRSFILFQFIIDKEIRTPWPNEMHQLDHKKHVFTALCLCNDQLMKYKLKTVGRIDLKNLQQ